MPPTWRTPAPARTPSLSSPAPDTAPAARLPKGTCRFTARPWLSPLAGLVDAARLPRDDVHPVVGVDERDERHERGKLVIVIVLGGIRPGLVGDAARGIGDASALLGEFQSGPLGLGEDVRIPPCRD